MSDNKREYQWAALFRDGEALVQYESGKYHNWREHVLPRAHELKSFNLTGHFDGAHNITVDFDTGDFIIDGKRLPFKLARHVDIEYPIDSVKGLVEAVKPPLRPIFNIVSSHHMNHYADGSVKHRFEHVYCIGWQATVRIPHLEPGAKYWSEKEVNVKHILYVHPDGSLVFG